MLTTAHCSDCHKLIQELIRITRNSVQTDTKMLCLVINKVHVIRKIMTVLIIILILILAEEILIII